MTFHGSGRMTTFFVAPRNPRTGASSFAERIVASRPTSTPPRCRGGARRARRDPPPVPGPRAPRPPRERADKRGDLAPPRHDDGDGASPADFAERLSRAGVRRLDDVGSELRTHAGRVPHDVDVIRVTEGRATRVHHREEREAEAITVRRRGPEVAEHSVVVLASEVYVDAHCVRAVRDRFFDPGHRDLTIGSRAQ